MPCGLGDLFVVTAIRLSAFARMMQIISEDINKQHVANNSALPDMWGLPTGDTNKISAYI